MVFLASNAPTVINALIYKGSLWNAAYPILDANGDLIPDATGLTPRAQIRGKPGATDVLYNFPGATVNTTDKTVELRVPSATSAAWTWRAGFLEIEVIDASGEANTIAAGVVRTRENIAR